MYRSNPLPDRPLILHVINDLSRGGAELLLANTLALLPEFRHLVVHLFPNSELLPALSANGIEAVCLDHTGWESVISSRRKLRELIRAQKPILVHSHLFHSTICARLAVPKSIPLVFTLHSLYSHDAFGKSVVSLIMARVTIRKRHTLVAVSDCVLRDYLNYVPFRGRTFVLHNFLPDCLFQKRTQKPAERTIRFVCVGNLKHAKNYHYLLEVFELLKQQDISLDIYGSGPLQSELTQIIRDKKLKVQLRGHTTDAPRMFYRYHFFIQASEHEGFGLSVIEAMASGIPVILSDIPVFREITNNLAFFFPLQNAAKAAGIIRQIANSQDAMRFVDSAFDHVKNRYSSKPYRQKLLSIYREVLDTDKM